MPFVDLKSVRLRYELTGPQELPVLVLSHSLGAGLEMWDSQMTALGEQFRLLRYDTRGLGQSSVPPGPYNVAQLGQDVIELMDALGIAKASFCGLSMGGSTGQWLGIHAPERIEKLVLASTAMKIGNEEGWNARIATVLKDGLDDVVPGALQRWFTEGFRGKHPEVVARIEAILRAADVQGYAANTAAVRDADFREDAGRINVPVLVISGTHDVTATPEDGKRLAASIPGARYVELDAAHLCNVEAAGAFNGAVLEFLGA